MPPDRLPNAARIEQLTPTHVPRTPSSYVLQLQLKGAVPECAYQCLTTYVNQEYKCPQHGISCLCQQYSSQGFTLGELAYICVHQDCKHASRSESLAQYNICSTVSSAVTATHSVLTPPATTHSNSLASSTTRILPSLETTSASSIPTRSGKSGAMGPSAFDTRSGLFASATAAASSASPSSVHSTHVTPPQAAGISIAVLAATALIIVAVYFCIRRRKKKLEDGEKSRDLFDNSPPRLSSTLTIKPAGSVRRYDRDTIRCWQQMATAPTPQRRQNNETSPESVESYGSARTESHLLPNKVPPIPARQQPNARSDSADTAATEFEDESVPVGRTWKGPGLPASPQASLDLSTTLNPQKRPPVANKALMSPDNRNLPPLSLKIPKSAARLPKIPTPAPVARPPLLNPRESSKGSDQRRSTASRSLSRDSSVSLLNYYASSEAGVSESPELVDSPTAMEAEVPKLPVPSNIVITRPADPRSLTRKNSAASDTSFESSDTDEPTPPDDEDKQLTPVQESPFAQRSPISDIRYPKIPRSANQIVPRSPGYKSSSPGFLYLQPDQQSRHGSQQSYIAYSPRPTQQQEWPLQAKVIPERQVSTKSQLSGSTLAAKRRGESAAHNLELKLNTGETSYSSFQKLNSSSQRDDRYKSRNDPNSLRHESPLKGYGRTASGGKKASRGQQHSQRKNSRRDGKQDRPLKSPIWEPKLTPEKRGEDLYLQVGVATPMQANFRQ